MGSSYSIIIPVKEINDYIRQTVEHIRGLRADRWEVFILMNDECDDEWQDSKISRRHGTVGPARKRDIGAELATGDILVFSMTIAIRTPIFWILLTAILRMMISWPSAGGITPREQLLAARIGAVF